MHARRRDDVGRRFRTAFAVLLSASLLAVSSLAALVNPPAVLAAPTLTLTPDEGIPGEPFIATFDIDGPCDSAPDADFYWEGTLVGSVPWGLVSGFPCRAELEIYPASYEPGSYTVTAEACGIDACGDAASASYTVREPVRTLTLSPTSGVPGRSFLATYYDEGCGSFAEAEFLFDGVPVAGLELMSAGCSASKTITTSSLESVGPHTVVARTCVDGPSTCPAGGSASATYTVVAPIRTLTLTPSSGPAGSSFDATYFDEACNDGTDAAQFLFDGTEQPGLVPFSDCLATMTITTSSTEAPGPHTVVAHTCMDGPGTCPGGPSASAEFTVTEPTPSEYTATLTLTPTHGFAGFAFSALYSVGPTCAGTVRFSFEGTLFATEPISAPACTATASFTPPSGTAPDRYRVRAIMCAGPCNNDTVATARYEVDPPAPTVPPVVPDPATPTPSLSPSPSASASVPPPSLVPSPSASIAPPSAVVSPPPPSATATPRVSAAPTPRVSPRPTARPTQTPGPTPPPGIASAPPATPTPQPSPVPSAEPSPSASAPESPSPSSTATLSPEPSPSPSSPTPVPSQAPSAAPTPESSPAASAPATPAASTPVPSTAGPTPAGSVLSATTPPGGNAGGGGRIVPAFTLAVAEAADVQFDPDVLLTNLLLTLLVILLFAVTSYLFNSTIDENRATIVAWRERAAHWLWPITGPLQRADGALKRGVEAARLSGVARVVVVLGLSGLIYGFLDPNFGLNEASVILFIALVIGLGISTYLTEGGSSFLAERRHRVDASVRLLGAGIVVAIVCVAASRLIDFRPGFVFGFIASSVILTPVALSRRASAELVVVPGIVMLIAALAAWLMLAPLRATVNADPSPLPVLLETVAATIFIGGLEGLFFTLIPLSFMDGVVVYRWNRLVWAVLFGLSTFLFWQLVINREAKYLEAFKQSSVLVCIALLAVYGGGTLLVWAYFRWRKSRERAMGGEAAA